MLMIQRIRRTLDIATSDQDVGRRGRNVIILALGLVGFALLLLPFVLQLPEWREALALLSVLVIVQVGAIALARQGLVNGAALLIIAMAIVGPVLAQWFVRASLMLPFQLTVPLLFASVTLRPTSILVVLAAALAGLVAMGFAAANLAAGLLQESLVMCGGLLVLTALIGVLGAASTARALAAASQARAELEATMNLVTIANAELENRVAARTSELSASLAAQKHQADDLRAIIASNQHLDALLAELALPIIPVRSDTLVVPLIGALDANRTNSIFERVLQAVEAQQARTLIIDVTGVPMIDTAIAGTLIKLAQAVRLLGAKVTLVGVRPEVAQSLVSLGVDLRELHSEATLQQGLERLYL